MLLEVRVNAVSVLQWDRARGFHLGGVNGNDFRDRWGLIHARQMHPSFYDPESLRLSQTGINYLLPIFANAVGQDDLEAVRQTLFNSGKLTQSTPCDSTRQVSVGGPCRR